MEKRVAAARDRLKEVEQRLGEPDVVTDPEKMKDLGREHRRLKRIEELGERWETQIEELENARELANDDDPEMAEMAAAEMEALEPKLDKAESDLKLALIPPDPADDRDAIVEIRAGTGGEEAGLFAGDLYRMYTRYAEIQGWKTETISSSASEMGGFKEIVFAVRGEEAFGRLKYEGGVHRVQRVPETESQGRIHTSAASVAVLPEAEEVDVQIDPNDLRIDVFRSSGPGGQSVNTTDSAVRITHLPTGLVVSCQDEKSQHKNKAKALTVLRSRLYEQALAEEQAKRSESRRLLVG
ncbi:peptide chain release factor 1, partial [bacterium]|nr:peptide chain release factor 1 [bacterium]